MKTQFVKTSNHEKFMAALKSLQGAAKEARILLLSGEPGTGKSREMDFHGSLVNAIHIDGIPQMTVGYIKDLMAYEMGVMGVMGGKRFQQQRAIQEELNKTGQMIILDEAQHGLERKAEVVEYLRRLTEQSGSTLVLVCHTSERHRFGEHRLAHIATRISSVVEFTPATLDDCALYLTELCEVGVDADIVQQVHKTSRGRYRLMTSACHALEVIAKQKKVDRLTIKDVKEIELCIDAMKSLKKGA